VTPIPVTVCLMTTTKGHFGVTSRYLSTLDSFEKALPFLHYRERLAHIKDSGESSEALASMRGSLFARGFPSWVTEGKWSHGTESHQLEYVKDSFRIVNNVKTSYVLMLEDDWLLKVYEGEFIDYVRKALDLFEADSSLVQIRIPRYSNEVERINGLKQKHGLDRAAVGYNDTFFYSNDFSANPAFYRTRDLRAALAVTSDTNLPKHIEHGLGVALKLISRRSQTPFACFYPEKIRIGHIGTRPGEEDDLDKPLIAT